MQCPRCQTENPEGRGFCVACAYPLPEERRQPEPEPVNENAQVVANAMTNGWGYAPTAPVPTTPRRRVLPTGIVAFGLGIESLAMAFLSVMPLLYSSTLSSAFYMFGSNEPLFTASYAMIYGILALAGGIAGTILGTKAMGRSAKEPERYAARGLYRAGAIISAIAAVVAMLAVVGAILYTSL